MIPEPANIAAKRVIGVSAPVPFHPYGGWPVVTRPVPRWAWAAISAGGEVGTLSANPYWPRLVTGTDGVSPNAFSSPDD